MSDVCTNCEGRGRKRVSFFRTKVCGTCKGKGYVRNQASDIQRQPFLDDGIISVPFASTEKHHVHEEPATGQGGAFGGRGASAHWDNPQSNTSTSSDSSFSSSDSSSSSSGDSGGSSGGGD